LAGAVKKLACSRAHGLEGGTVKSWRTLPKKYADAASLSGKWM
jgi:hypothetical protein